MIVLDASVIVKWFVQEADSPLALTYKAQLVSGRQIIAAPDLLLYEVASALRKKPDVTPEAIEIAVEGLLDVGLHVVDPTPALLKEAAHLSLATHLTVYDCTYLALANELDCSLITADHALVRQAEPLAAARLLSTR